MRIFKEKQMNWKDIIGYEGFYQVSDTGLVKSVERTVMSGGFPRKRVSKTLKPHTNKYGYLVIDLSKNGKTKKRTIHSLVADAFLNEIGDVVNHKDGDKLNNHYSNLEKISARENTQHAVDNNLIPRGSKNHKAKIDEKMAFQIKCLLLKGELTMSAISRAYKINRCIVKHIKDGTTWNYLTATDYPSLTTVP